MVMEAVKENMSMIEVGMFVTSKDSSHSKYGINEGDTLYVAGDSFVRVNEEDPYLFRKIFIVAKVKGGSVKPNEGAYTVDGSRLSSVPEEVQERLTAKFAREFDGIQEG